MTLHERNVALAVKRNIALYERRTTRESALHHNRSLAATLVYSPLIHVTRVAWIFSGYNTEIQEDEFHTRARHNILYVYHPAESRLGL